MSKRQSYTIVFNQDQTDATTAMFQAGGQLSTEVRDLINTKILSGDVSDDSTPSLSEDGYTLTVQRTWTDSAYSELLALDSDAGIIAAVISNEEVESCTYEFTDI